MSYSRYGFQLTLCNLHRFSRTPKIFHLTGEPEMPTGGVIMGLR
jgi:hypothetical protein